jgi:hypothetical protein
MDYSFKYKLPEGLQARPVQEKLVGAGQAKQVLLENRPPVPPVATQARPTDSGGVKPRFGGVRRVALVATTAGAALGIGLGWIAYDRAPAQHQPAQPIGQPSQQLPAIPAPPSAVPPAAQQFNAQPSAAPGGQQQHAQVTTPTTTIPQQAQYQSAPQAPQNVAQNGSSVGSSHSNALSQTPQPRARAAAQEDSESDAAEPERPRRRWRSQRSEANAEQRSSARHAPEGSGASKPSDRERLF